MLASLNPQTWTIINVGLRATATSNSNLKLLVVLLELRLMELSWPPLQNTYIIKRIYDSRIKQHNIKYNSHIKDDRNISPNHYALRPYQVYINIHTITYKIFFAETR